MTSTRQIKGAVRGVTRITDPTGSAEPGPSEPSDNVSELAIVQLGDLAGNASDGERALLDAGVEIYQYAGKLVRPIVERVTAADGRKTEVARLEEISATYLRDLLARHARWQAFSAREKKWVKKDPPMDIAKTILARAGEWKFPPISGVVSTQTMRADGSLLLQAGYDPATQLLLLGPPAMPPIPAKPSREQASQALALLEDLLEEFPFADGLSLSVALSALITPIVRGAFPVAPMHVVDATAPGSGKSYLGDVAASMAIGQPMPVMAAGRSEEETEKRIGAALMVGQPLISIDNVTGGLGGDALCVVIERSSVRMRILGLSEQARIEARGTTFYATGNNIVVIGDMCRRVVTARLDPKVERPELREFKSDPVSKIMRARGVYIAAALTICRGYIAADRPQLAGRLASFEGWSDIVRSALIWLGKADPVASMERTRDQDPETVDLRTILAAWADAIGIGPEKRCTLSEIIEASARHPDLHSAIEAVAGKKQKADARSLGRWLQQKQGTVVDHHRFSVRSNKKGKSSWWIDDLRGGSDRVQGGQFTSLRGGMA